MTAQTATGHTRHGLTSLFLGAVVSERRKAEEGLRRSEAGLKEAQRVARLWQLDDRSSDRTTHLDRGILPHAEQIHRFPHRSIPSWRAS